MIGTALSRHLLNQGYDVIILSRNPVQTASVYKTSSSQNSFRPSGNIFYARWDTDKKMIDPQAIAKADHIVHLAGEGVAKKRWTKKRKEEIRLSRTQSSELLFSCLTSQPNKVKSVISASAIGWYGPDQGKVFTEEDPSSNDFLGQTCKAWEQSIDKVESLGKRLVKLRLGIALSNEGGALAEFKKPARFGVAAVLGSGNQVTSWIHIDDISRMFIHLLTERSDHSVYNGVAPRPLTNKKFTEEVRDAFGSGIVLPAPALGLKIALGEMSKVVLNSNRVLPKNFTEVGFRFEFPDLTNAIKDLLVREV